MTLRRSTRSGSSVAEPLRSVFDCFHLGSSMALRSFSPFESALLLFGMGSSLAVFDFLHLGSTLSLRYCMFFRIYWELVFCVSLWYVSVCGRSWEYRLSLWYVSNCIIAVCFKFLAVGKFVDTPGFRTFRQCC